MFGGCDRRRCLPSSGGTMGAAITSRDRARIGDEGEKTDVTCSCYELVNGPC